MEIKADTENLVQESTFSQWPFSPEVLKSIEDLGYTKPTPVQAACIPRLLSSKTDLLALAKTGTGKTAAFGLPLVERLTTEKRLQALVLCPTRELAAQVSQHLQSMGLRKGLKVVTILGGESYRRQIDALKNNPQILVSTPGRLIDLMDQKVIKLAGVNHFILDEADEMLSFGFQDALETVWKQLAGNDFNTWLFSATMSDSIKRLTKKYLKTPVEVSLNYSTEVVRIESFAAVVFEEDKEDALALLIQSEPSFYGIIFAQTKQQVANLELRFRSMGFDVDSLHGDKAQADRTRTINRMKKREVQILVATDVAARGLDIEDLTHVVNFELPWDIETYTHRVGRTARAGKKGIVWTMVRPKESQFLRKFERALKFEFKTLRIPSVDDVRSSQIRRWLLDVTKATVSRKDTDLLEKTFSELESAEIPNMVPETKQWLMKAMSFMKVGADSNLRQPRSFELRAPLGDDRRDDRRDDRGPSRGITHQRDNRRGPPPGRGGGFRGDFRPTSHGSQGDSRPSFRQEDRPRGNGTVIIGGAPARNDRRTEFRKFESHPSSEGARGPRPRRGSGRDDGGQWV